ncbi:MAG: hypothetical protein D6762_03375 [Candidatus Neomarinimicrobiota bacterium]|nr:MAG: hypothetical protein D6762_03375 [Candidatus Neomarinimicrobiota bacterium]
MWTWQAAVWAFVIMVLLFAFYLSWRYFFATTGDVYRSRIRRCSNCDRFKPIGSVHDGYCRIWKRNVIKKEICKHYYPKNLWVHILEKAGF